MKFLWRKNGVQIFKPLEAILIYECVAKMCRGWRFSPLYVWHMNISYHISMCHQHRLELFTEWWKIRRTIQIISYTTSINPDYLKYCIERERKHFQVFGPHHSSVSINRIEKKAVISGHFFVQHFTPWNSLLRKENNM